jgi:hypothetical protein
MAGFDARAHATDLVRKEQSDAAIEQGADAANRGEIYRYDNTDFHCVNTSPTANPTRPQVQIDVPHDSSDDSPAPPRRSPNSATFIIHNHDRFKVGLKLFSKSRTWIWPGSDQHWDLSNDGTYNISCNAGEKICFGAWRNDVTYWGVGEEGNQGCTNCCTTCGNTYETTLNDAGAGGSGSASLGDVLDGAAAILNGAAGGSGGGGGGGGYRISPVRPVPSGTSNPPQSTITGH